MTTVAMFLLALATCLSAGVALWIALTFIDRDRRLRQQKASVLRAQLIGQIQTIRDSVIPRGRSLDPPQKESYEPLAFLWMQADLLGPEEIQAVNRCVSTLLALRHKPSVNQTQARLAHRLIDETCTLLARSDAFDQQPASHWSLAHRLIKELPGFASIRPNTVARPPQPHAPTEIGMLNN